MTPRIRRAAAGWTWEVPHVASGVTATWAAALQAVNEAARAELRRLGLDELIP